MNKICEKCKKNYVKSGCDYCYDCLVIEYDNLKNNNCNKEIKRLRSEKTILEKNNELLEDQILELKEQWSKKNKQIEKITTEKTSKEQPDHELKRKYRIALICIILLSATILSFAIITIVLSSKNNSLEQKISYIENKVIPPLQAEHDFTPQYYKSVVDKCYFDDDNNRYILYGEKIKIIRIKNNFAYGTSTNGENTISGWVRLGDITPLFGIDKIKNFINTYYDNIQSNKFEQLSMMYAPNVNRFFDAKNIKRNTVIEKLKNHDKNAKIYEKSFNIDWNTLEIKSYEDKIEVVYRMDYSIVREDKTKPSKYLLEMHVELNLDYQIISIYENILREE